MPTPGGLHNVDFGEAFSSYSRPLGRRPDQLFAWFQGHELQERKLDAEPDNEVPFTVGVIVLSAKMAKADGSVAADEVKAFKEAFKVSPAEMTQVASVFNSAKRDTANFEECAEQLVTVFKGNRKLLEHVLDGCP